MPHLRPAIQWETPTIKTLAAIAAALALSAVAADAQPGPKDLTEAQVHAVIDPWYSQFTVATRGDVKAIWEKVVSPDYQSRSGYLPGDCLGRDTANQLIGGLTTAIPDLKYRMKEVLISGDRVTVLGETLQTSFARCENYEFWTRTGPSAACWSAISCKHW